MSQSCKRLFQVITAMSATLLFATGAMPVQAATTPTPTPTPTPAQAPLAPPKPTPTPKVSAPQAPAPLPPKVVRRAAALPTAPSAALPDSTCSLSGTVRTCDLWAHSGTIKPPGAPPEGIAIWGFTLTEAAAATLPGPTLIAGQGESLKINLHNRLPKEAGELALEVPGGGGVPDLAGIAAGSDRTYTLDNLAPGSYLYQAGSTPGGPRMVAMGLSGLLIIRPAKYADKHAAYDTGGSEFTAEAVFEVSEIDSEFNKEPFAKDLHEYSPNFFLLNGRAFDPAAPGAGKIDVAPGDKLLVRYANLGLQDHGLSILGHRQNVMADDSRRLTNPQDVANKWLTSGQTSDALVTVDPAATLGSKYPVYEGGFHLHNDTGGGLGGMLTYLEVVSGLGGTPGGPLTSNLQACIANDATCAVRTYAVGNEKDNGKDADVALKGTIAARTGTLQAAEWFIDDIGAAGTGTKIPVPAGTSTFTMNFRITLADVLAALAKNHSPVDGDHIFWVHGQDSLGTWGTATGDVLTFDSVGPVISAINLHSPPTNDHKPNDIDGSNDVVVIATADASLADWVVLKAEYCIDNAACAKGSGRVLTTNPPPTANPPTVPAACVPGAQAGPPPPPPPPPTPPGGAQTVSVCGLIPAGDLKGLGEGSHTINIRAFEARNVPPPASGVQGRWGDNTVSGATAQFVIDRTGPATKNIVLNPNPNNGHQGDSGNLGFLNSFRVSATLDDAASGGSDIVLGEAFLGSSAPPASDYGKGAEMWPVGGQWGGTTKDAYAQIPLTELQAAHEGIVKVWVHGKDAAGNWGAPVSADMILDKTSPRIVSTSATAGTIRVNATDPVANAVHTNIVGAEWFVGTDPGAGNGTAITGITPGYDVSFTFNPGPKPAGTRISIRVRDAAGNWSLVAEQPV